MCVLTVAFFFLHMAVDFILNIKQTQNSFSFYFRGCSLAENVQTHTVSTSMAADKDIFLLLSLLCLFLFQTREQIYRLCALIYVPLSIKADHHYFTS